MVSDAVDYVLSDGKVLILVLMEDGLGRAIAGGAIKVTGVLILVLMEDGLGLKADKLNEQAKKS